MGALGLRPLHNYSQWLRGAVPGYFSIEEVRMFQAAVRLEYISIEYSYRTSVLFCWFPELRYGILGIVWGIRNLTVRAAILGLIKTGLLLKPLPGMFSLIKSER